MWETSCIGFWEDKRAENELEFAEVQPTKQESPIFTIQDWSRIFRQGQGPRTQVLEYRGTHFQRSESIYGNSF